VLAGLKAVVINCGETYTCLIKSSSNHLVETFMDEQTVLPEALNTMSPSELS
jgi:hypothetical protein